MAKPRIRLLTLAAAAITALLCTAAMSSPAVAETKAPVHAKSAAASYTWFWLTNDTYGNCIVEDGDTQAVYMDTCDSNHSDYWRWTAAGMLLNEHSGLCITSNGTSSGVIAFSCSNYSTQIWNTTAYTGCNLGTPCFTLRNYDTQQLLVELDDGSLTQTCTSGSTCVEEAWYWDIFDA
jgi:hypothetical protein